MSQLAPLAFWRQYESPGSLSGRSINPAMTSRIIRTIKPMASGHKRSRSDILSRIWAPT
jgi:hypothetical protein